MVVRSPFPELHDVNDGRNMLIVRKANPPGDFSTLGANFVRVPARLDGTRDVVALRAIARS